jgi:O-antigen/teichoic acid export membrane protein
LKQARYKLLEISSRSLFILSVLYFFPVELAGKFGFILLLFGFFSIFYGFERYISLQREIINESEHSVSRKLASTFRFYIFNFLISCPLLAILLFNYGISNIILILCCLLISFTEHISNAVYNISIVYSTYLVAMPSIIIKNLFMFILVVLLIFFKQENTIEIIIYCWSILSFLQLIIFSKWFANSLSVSKIQFWKYSLGEIKNHYSVAKINFLIGLISVLSLQCDRLIVGYSFDSFFTGIYFRHVSLISIFYQLFNIVSYNRMVPKIFSEAKEQPFSRLRKSINNEFKNITLILVVFTILFVLGYYLLLKPFFLFFHIDIYIVLFLLIIFYIKIYADFQGMILNALNLEIKLCIFQFLTVLISVLLMLAFIPHFQISGVLFASFIGTIFYASIMYFYKPSLKLARN